MINNREINSIANNISQLSIISPSIYLSSYLSIYIPYGPLQVSAHLSIFMDRFIYTYLCSVPVCIINQWNKIFTVFLNFLKQSWEEKAIEKFVSMPILFIEKTAVQPLIHNGKYSHFHAKFRILKSYYLSTYQQ